jgi:polyhydroxybutyrate depolymerase
VKPLALAAATLAVLLALAPRRAGAADLALVEIEHQGRTRSVHVFVPPGHERTRPVPLVLALHGGGGTGARFDASTNGSVTREAARRGWIVAFPDGVERGWNDGRDIRTGRDALRADVDDVGFLARTIDRLHETLGIDLGRVYATGISNGGFMSFRLATDLAERIAAVAPVTAQMTPQLVVKRPARPVPVMLVNGTEDPLVPYDGGQVRVFGQDRGAVLSTDLTVRFWTLRNGCSGPTERGWLPDRARDGTRVRVDRYLPREGGAEVVLYRVEGGGHTWPGGRPYLPVGLVGRVSRDFDATAAIFDFFARQPPRR